MSTYISLIKAHFTTGTRYYSFEGVSSPTQFYKDRIIRLSTISRKIDPQGTTPTLSTGSVEFSNVEGEFSALRAIETFRSTKLEFLFGNIDAGLAAMSTLFTAVIYDWNLTTTTFSVTLRDSTFDVFSTSIGGLTTVSRGAPALVGSTIFPKIPTTTPQGQLVPIMYGQNYSGGETDGRLPVYLIDTAGPTAGKPYRYVVAQHTVKSVYQVYNYGSLVSSANYAVTTATYGGLTMTVIDFNFDPRNSNRANQNEITVLLQGRVDGSVNLITNPADQLLDFLETWGGLSSGLFNTAMWTVAHNTAIGTATNGMSGSCTFIDPTQTFSDIISFFNQSFGLWFFVDSAGLYGCFLYTTYTSPFSGGVIYQDVIDIAAGSLHTMPTKTIATRMAFNSSFNFNTNKFERFPVTSLYKATVLADSPSSYYRMDALSGTAETDIIAGNNGTYTGAPTLGVTGVLPGDSDTAVTLNGTTQYMTAPDNAANNLGDVLTLEAWVKITTTAPAHQFIFSKYTAWEFSIESGGTLRLAQVLAAYAGVNQIAPSTVALTINVWHHVVATKNGSAVHLYLDGADVTGTVTNFTLSNVANQMAIGIETSFNWPLSGSVDEAAIYKTVLSASQVLAHYNAGITAHSDYSVDDYAELTTGQIAEVWDLPFAINASGGPWDARLQLLSESQDYANFNLPINEYSGLDLGNQISITAKRGVGSNGYSRRRSTVIGIDINAQPSQMQIALATLLFAPLYSYDPSTVANNNSMPAPWTCATDGTNSANHIASGLIEMRYNATSAGSRAIFDSTSRFSCQQASLIYSSGVSGGYGGPAVRLGGTDASPVGVWVAYDLSGPTLKLYVSVTGSAVLLASKSIALVAGDEVKVVNDSNYFASGKIVVWGELNGVRVLGPIRYDPAGTLLPLACGTLSQCPIGGTLEWSYGSFGILQYHKAIYQNQVTADSPIAYWRMDASSGTTETDIKATYNGTYTGTPTLNTTGLLAEDSNAAVAFNGSSQHMTASPVLASSSDQSIELWFTTGVNASLANLFDVTTHNGLALLVAAADAEFQFSTSGTIIHSGVALVSGQKYHVVGTINHTTGAMVLYVNGVSMATGTGATTSITTCVVADNISGTAKAKGTIDEVALYNSVLTPARVLYHYQTGLGIAI